MLLTVPKYFSGKISKLLLENKDDFSVQYDLPIEYHGDRVELRASSGRCSSHKETLLKPCRTYRVWLRCDIAKGHPLPYPVRCTLAHFEDTRLLARQRAMRKEASGRAFIK
jgi:hypothetical protein